jgi:hypothetical protein
VLPPFVAGLLAMAGRMLGLLAYRDAFALGDQPLNRRSAKNKATVFTHLPTACDRQDRAWRLAWARCLDDLAGDLEAGRAPLPRCTEERWALQVMADRTPYLLACSDAELTDLGVPVPLDEQDYRPPYWDGVVEEFLVNDAEYSIPEASTGNDGPDEKPDDGWAAPRFWFSPYGITIARAPDRGYPPWVHARLTGSTTDPDGGFEKPAALLGYTSRADAWEAYTDDYRGDAEYRVLAEVLTPKGPHCSPPPRNASPRWATRRWSPTATSRCTASMRTTEAGTSTRCSWPTCPGLRRVRPGVAAGDGPRRGRPGRGPAGGAGAAAPVLPRKDGVLPCLVLQARPEEQFYRAECQSANARRGIACSESGDGWASYPGDLKLPLASQPAW